MKNISKQFIDIIIRYIILVLIALPNLFFGASLVGKNIVLVGELPIELINSCIAGSAYYLLLILNLSTPKIKLKKRIKIMLLSFASLLIINILRIFLLGFLAISGFSYFDLAHKLFWYLLSIVFVTGIWFAQVKYFKIKQIPFYSDMKFLYKNSVLSK